MLYILDKYTQGTSFHHWPYPAPRPSFATTWRYKLINDCHSLSALALSFRILVACLRWDEMLKPVPNNGSSIMTIIFKIYNMSICFIY